MRWAAHLSPTPIIRLHRVLVRRPWLYWLAVSALAGSVFAITARHDASVEQAKAAWGDTREVFVAVGEHDVGDPIEATPLLVPVAAVPRGAVVEPPRGVAHQHIGEGEIITDADLAATGAPQSLIPEGWLAVPIVESPRSGARVGDWVRLVSGGLVISADALIVGASEGATLVAVPAEEAAAVPAAASVDALTVLLKP